MRSTWMKRVVSIGAVFVLSACTGTHVKQGDTLAKVGDWETALAQYRVAVEKNPNDALAKRKLLRAEREVIAVWTKRGNQANSAGRLGEAGTWWRKAVELTHPLERTSGNAWAAIQKNATALEYHGDVAFGEQRYEEAIGTWGAVLLVDPDRGDIIQKNGEAQKEFAAELHELALSLAKRNLLGAALVTDLRALRYDPMQSEAFSAGSTLRRTMRSRTRIAVQEIKLEDKGYKGLSGPLLARLTPHMEDYPPYGPTKDPAAMRASFTVTIEEFDRKEETKEGKDELVNDEVPSTVPIANPAIPEQRAKVAALDKRLRDKQLELKASIAAKRSGKPQPYGEDKGLELARTIDQTKEDLAVARRVLEQLPPKVQPPPPSPTWTLPWTETTRSVTARVRFEISEPDFPEPIVLTLTETVSKTDRAHDGSVKHAMAADALKLPSYDEMVVDLAKKLEHGNDVLRDARQRRVDTLIEKGRDHANHSREGEALDAFVAVLFLMGPQALPADAAAFVSKTLEHDRFKDVIAQQ
jgi:tetratricopeptide (TPR) repeat protein